MPGLSHCGRSEHDAHFIYAPRCAFVVSVKQWLPRPGQADISEKRRLPLAPPQPRNGNEGSVRHA